MGTGGLSEHRLERITEVLTEHVESGGVPGVAWLLSRRGETHSGVIGTMELGGGAPLRRDTIFRIASMSKPVTAVATLILLEECRLRLDRPVDDLLPELADRRVLSSPGAALDDTVPAERRITVRDLLTFTFGYGAIFAAPGTYPIADAAAELGVGVSIPKSTPVPSSAEWIRRLGGLPLVDQPGRSWMYHSGSSVLGVLIERASGMALDDFLRERIFEPLGMKDTGFVVPARDLDRLPVEYWTDPATGEAAVYDSPADSKWARAGLFYDAGGDLVSTLDDYRAFAQMLLGNGRYGGERILSRGSVAAMTSAQTTAEQLAGPFSFFEPGYAWGYGVGVAMRRLGPAVTPGQYGWDGGLGTSWKNDPEEDLVGIVLTQRAFESAQGSPVVWDFWTSAYQAIDD